MVFNARCVLLFFDTIYMYMDDTIYLFDSIVHSNRCVRMCGWPANIVAVDERRLQNAKMKVFFINRNSSMCSFKSLFNIDCMQNVCT